MPTLTRLAAAVFFAALAFYAGEAYQILYEDPPRRDDGSLYLAGIAAFVGWRFVGKKINSNFMQSVFNTLQGVILTLFLTLVWFGTYHVFVQGYRVRYSNLEEAFLGFVGVFVDHLLRMADMDFMLMLGGMIVGTGIALTLLFRWAEARRFDQ